MAKTRQKIKKVLLFSTKSSKMKIFRIKMRILKSKVRNPETKIFEERPPGFVKQSPFIDHSLACSPKTLYKFRSRSSRNMPRKWACRMRKPTSCVMIR